MIDKKTSNGSATDRREFLRSGVNAALGAIGGASLSGAAVASSREDLKDKIYRDARQRLIDKLCEELDAERPHKDMKFKEIWKMYEIELAKARQTSGIFTRRRPFSDLPANDEKESAARAVDEKREKNRIDVSTPELLRRFSGKIAASSQEQLEDSQYVAQLAEVSNRLPMAPATIGGAVVGAAVAAFAPRVLRAFQNFNDPKTTQKSR